MTTHHSAQLFNHSASQRHSQILYPRQPSDAILYASLVALFYAAIILIVVGSNCHRFRKQPDTRSRRTAKHLLTLTDPHLNIFHIVLKRHRPPATTNPSIATV